MIIIALCTLLIMAAPALSADSQVEVARVQAAASSYMVFAITVTAVKISALILGYLIAKLGYSTMMAGVQGDNAVELGAFGTSFKFKGVTPGLALGLVGILMMGWALSTKHHFSSQISKDTTEINEGSAQESNQQGVTNEPSKPVPPKL